LGTHAQTLASIGMTGGNIALGSGANLNLTGNLTAISDLSAPALITGTGALSLTSATPTFIVNKSGAQTTDLFVGATITGNALTKQGIGRLELAANDTQAGTTVNAGDVQVDSGSSLSGGVTLSGGSLSGKGAVSGITSSSVAAPNAPTNTVNPGYSGTAAN